MSRNENFDAGSQQWPVGHSTSMRVHVGDGKHRTFEGKIVEESETHVSVQVSSKISRNQPAGSVINVHKGRIRSRQDTAPKTRNTRSSQDRESDRSNLLSQIGEDWVRAPEGANRSDINHLIKAGHLESDVRETFDKQKGKHSSGYFGGAGVVKRKRQYLRKPPQS